MEHSSADDTSSVSRGVRIGEGNGSGNSGVEAAIKLPTGSFDTWSWWDTLIVAQVPGISLTM